MGGTIQDGMQTKEGRDCHIHIPAGERLCLIQKLQPREDSPSSGFLYLQRMSENSVFPSLLTMALAFLPYSQTEACFFYSGVSPLSPAASWGLAFRCPGTASNSLCLKAISLVLAQQQSISLYILYLEILYFLTPSGLIIPKDLFTSPLVFSVGSQCHNARVIITVSRLPVASSTLPILTLWFMCCFGGP